jgi:hypothetical protein
MRCRQYDSGSKMWLVDIAKLYQVDREKSFCNTGTAVGMISLSIETTLLLLTCSRSLS